MLKYYTFVYSNPNSCQLYFTNLNASVNDGIANYTYLSSNVINIDKCIKTKASLINNTKHLNTTSFTNIKRDSNLYRLLRRNFNPLQYYNPKLTDLEQGLFEVKDLIIGQNLNFSNHFYHTKILDHFNKLEDNLSNIATGDNCLLLSLVYLLEAIAKPKAFPAIGSTSFSTIF